MSMGLHLIHVSTYPYIPAFTKLLAYEGMETASINIDGAGI